MIWTTFTLLRLFFELFLAVWTLILVGNDLRVLIAALYRAIRQMSYNDESVMRARSLLIVGGFLLWASISLIGFGERFLYGEVELFTVELSFASGVLFMADAVFDMSVSLLSALCAALSRGSLPVQPKRTRLFHLILAILFWFPAWLST